jgi:hypothetical protein
MIDIDKQHEYLTLFKLNPLEIGELCEKYPALRNSWNQFLTILEICKENDNSST